MSGPACSDGLSALTSEALATASAALAAFAADPYDDAHTVTAAALLADAAISADTAARHGGLTSVTTFPVVALDLSRTAEQLQQLLAWAGNWLSTEITAGRVTGDRPPPDLADRARETGSATADCAAALASALRRAGLSSRALTGDEPGFCGMDPYDDLDTIRAASLAAEAARYLAAAVQGGGVTAAATLTGVTAGLVAAAEQLQSLLAWVADWLSAEITAGRVTGDGPLPELAANARAALEAPAGSVALLARGLRVAHDLTTVLRPAEQPAAAGAPPAAGGPGFSRCPPGRLADDLTIAMGPGIPAVAILYALEDAGAVHGPWDLWVIAWLVAAPLAVYLLHRAAPEPSPRAVAARRVLTWAAAIATAVLAAACLVVDCVLVTRHSIEWWHLLQPVPVTAPLLSARRAIPRNRPAAGPPGAAFRRRRTRPA